MPTYEYYCEDCGERFELFQKITDEALTVCPKCGGRLKRKITGGAGVIFKGTGFYEIDYKRKSSPKEKGKRGCE
ncbi:zinc ribbon domain-containing protein [bacterium]|nr:zinc ribbon domain-containing protein [bacterium]